MVSSNERLFLQNKINNEKVGLKFDINNLLNTEHKIILLEELKNVNTMNDLKLIKKYYMQSAGFFNPIQKAIKKRQDAFMKYHLIDDKQDFDIPHNIYYSIIIKPNVTYIPDPRL
jgi:hypothetical protein